MNISAQNLILEQLGQAVALIFAVLTCWLVFFQARVWTTQPQVVSSKSSVRVSVYFLALTSALIFAAILISDLQATWLPLALSVGLGVGASVVNEVAAFSFLTTLLIVRPWEVVVGASLVTSMPRISALIVFAMLLLRFVKERAIKIFWSKECTLLLIFSAWLLLTAQMSSNPAESQNFYLDNYLRGMILFYLMVNIVKTVQDVEIFRGVLVGGAFSIAILALFFTVFLGQNDSTERLTYVGLLGDPNDISAFALLAMPFAVKPFIFKRRGVLPILFALAYTLITLILIYEAQSRGAILAFLALMACFIIYRSQNKKRAVIMALFLSLLYFPSQMLLNREEGDLRESGQSRLIYWKTAVNMAIRHPVFGVGFNDYPNQYADYLTDVIPSESGKRTAHSSWFLILAENGFPGFLLFLGLVMYSLKRAYMIRKTHPEYLFSLITYSVAMSFLSHSYLIFPYLIFSFTLISSVIFSSERKI